MWCTLASDSILTGARKVGQECLACRMVLDAPGDLGRMNMFKVKKSELTISFCKSGELSKSHSIWGREPSLPCRRTPLSRQVKMQNKIVKITKMCYITVNTPTEPTGRGGTRWGPPTSFATGQELSSGDLCSCDPCSCDPCSCDLALVNFLL